MVSATGIASVFLLIGGIFIAVLQFNRHSYEEEHLSRVATPSFGSVNKQGPWPECIGMDGEACCDLIHQYSSDVRCFVIPENRPVTMDFSPTRVRVVVDEDNIVTVIPSRG